MTAHSKIGASSAYRWILCPASVSMSRGAKYESSDFAKEGTAAHELAEMCFLKKKMPHEFIGESILVEDTYFQVDEEMADNVALYVTEILSKASRKFNPSVVDRVEIEKRFDLNWLHEGMFGTCDANLPDTVARTLYVWDLKYGAGKAVYATENYQLMYYALGVLGEHGHRWFDNVLLTIVQPRHASVGVNSWEVSTEDLVKWGKEVLKPAVETALSENPPFNAGEEQCRWCPAKGKCPEIGRELSKCIDIEVNSIVPMEPQQIQLPNPKHLSLGQKAKLLTLLPLVKSYIEAIEAEAFEEAMNGNIMEGFKLVQKRAGNRRWTDEDAVLGAFAESLGDSLCDKKLKSPAQVEKLLPKDQRHLVEEFTVRPEAGLELKPVSDKRTAIEPNTVKPNYLEMFTE